MKKSTPSRKLIEAAGLDPADNPTWGDCYTALQLELYAQISGRVGSTSPADMKRASCLAALMSRAAASSAMDGALLIAVKLSVWEWNKRKIGVGTKT